MRTRITVLLLCILYLSSIAQNNSVLWRITGNGLTKPSYLFGTFHVKDKRVFYQNDSLKDLINACEYFSLELHPDSMNSLLFAGYNGSDTSKTDKAFNSFSDEEYRIVDEKLQKDLGVGLSQIKNRNLKFIKSLLSPSVKKKDDYPTFLDGYLLNIARRMNKRIIGLESIESQASALNYMKTNDADLKNEIVKLSKEKENHENFENLISYYQSEKIDLIHNLFTYQGLLITDIVLNKRNIVMARTIDSIVKKNTFFAACGSAHLSGEQGVIQLLKNMGYNLTPVIAKKKSYLNADKFPLDPNVTWNKISLPSFGVNYFLPGIPMAMKKSAVLSEAQMYSDITSGAVYMLLPINVSGSYTSKSEIFDKLEKTLKEKLNITSGLKVTDATEKGHDYRELNGEYKGFNVTIRFYLENNIMYYFFTTAPKNYDFDIEKKFFFSAIDFYSPVKQDQYYYRNPKWEMEITLPGKPVEADYSSRSNNTIFSKMNFKLTDNIQNIHYIFEASEAGEGRYYKNDTTLLNGISKKMKSAAKTIWLKDSAFVFKNYTANQIVGLFEDNSMIVCLSIVKGFKLYNMMAIMKKETYEACAYKATMNSFNLFSTPKQDYQFVKTPFDSLLSIQLPEPLSEYKVSDENYYTYDEWKEPLYTSFEKSEGITYYLTRKVESPYYYTTNDSVYWKNMTAELMDEGDSLVYEKDIKLNNCRSRQFCIIDKSSTCPCIYNIYSFGKYYYKMFAYLPRYDKTDYFLQPFNTVQFKGKCKEEVVQDTTAFDKLMNDLYSGDSIFVKRANDKFYKFKLTPAMYPRFQKITDTTGSNMRYKFVSKLSLFPFKQSAPFITEKLFAARRDSAYDDSYLNELAKYKTVESFAIIKKFLLQNISTIGDYYQTFATLDDSLKLAATLYPELATAFSKDTSYSENYNRLTTQLLDTGLINYDIIKVYEPDLKARASKYASVKVKDENYWDFYFPDSFLDVAAHSKDQSFHREIYSILVKSNNVWGKYYAFTFGLRVKLDIDPALVLKLCEMPYFRYRIFTDLKKEGKMEFFPAKYLNQLSMAEADIVVRILDTEEIMPTKVDFIKESKIPDKEKSATYYIFKISFRDVKEKYIGFAGPYYFDEPVTESASNTQLGEEYKKGKEEQMLWKVVIQQQIDNQ